MYPMISSTSDGQYFLLPLLYGTEAKCYCIYPLDGQRNETIKDTTNEIMCEKNGGLQPNGKCDDDEYCAGPNTLEDAVCGKKELCTKQGTNEFDC